MLGLNKKRKNLLAVWHETEHVLKTDILCRQSIEDSIERTIFYPETDVIYPNMKEKTGKKVPKDYSLVCFDYSNEDWKECGITCSVHQGNIMGVEVSKRLLRMMEKKDFMRRDYSCILEPYIHDGNSIAEAVK